MTDAPQHHRELAKCLMLLIDGRISESQSALLCATLRSDASARRFYLSYMRTHALLQQELEGRHVTFVLPPAELPSSTTWNDNGEFAPAAMEDSGTLELMRGVLEQEAHARSVREARREAQLERERAEQAERQRRLYALMDVKQPVKPVRHVVIPTWVVFGAAAAIIAIAITLAYPWLTPADRGATQPGGVTAAEPVGVITSTVDARWEDGAPVVAGAPVMPGRVRTLGTGLAQITLATGASVYIEAPATFEAVGEDHLRLLDGKIVGHCPPGAEGFTVTTPNARIVDLGTEFGVSVRDGVSSTHVFSGGVLVMPTQDGRPRDAVEQLSAHQAVRVGSEDQLTRMIADGLAFVRPFEFAAHLKAQDGSAYHRWLVHSLALRRDESLVAYYAFEREDQESDILRNVARHGSASPGRILGCGWTTGRFAAKPALRFTADDWGVECHVPGEFRRLTMAAWIKLDTLTDLPQTIVHGDGVREGFANWLFSEVGGMGFGIIDRLQVRAEELLGYPHLRQWHHYAVVLDDKAVTMYFDGQVVRKQAIIPVVVRIGSARIGNWNPLDAVVTAPNRSLHGYMDEFLLFDRALDASEIAAMHNAGRPER